MSSTESTKSKDITNSKAWLSSDENTGFLPTGVIHVRHSSEIVGANKFAAEHLGYPQDFELQDRKFLEICASLESDSWGQLLDALKDNVACEFSAVFMTYSGGHSELNCLAVNEIGASIIDIYLFKPDGYQNDNKGNYDAVFHKLEVCESFVETDLMDINIKNTDLEYEVTSALFERTFSLKPGEAVGKTPFDIYPPAFADHVASHDKMVLDRKQVVTQIDVVPYTGKHLLVQKFPLFKNDSLRGIGVFAVDVTSLKDTERRLLESKNKLSDYVDLCEDILWEAGDDWSLRESNMSGVSNILGIRMKIGINFLDELKGSLAAPSNLDVFLESLELDLPKKEIFELRNGSRIKLGVKKCSAVSNHNNSVLETGELYRGIITILKNS